MTLISVMSILSLDGPQGESAGLLIACAAAGTRRWATSLGIALAMRISRMRMCSVGVCRWS
jgi:hypothetical protein